MNPAPQTHDLPPAWDGVPVTWTDWELQPDTTMRFHDVAGDGLCAKCGTLGRQLTCRGTTDVHPGVIRFVTNRCLHCGHDVVLDLHDDTFYDLEPTDYGPDGSWADDLIEPTLPASGHRPRPPRSIRQGHDRR